MITRNDVPMKNYLLLRKCKTLIIIQLLQISFAVEFYKLFVIIDPTSKTIKS